MRFIATASKGRKRLQVTIEADSSTQAQIGADTWARYHRIENPDVRPDWPCIKVVDGVVTVQESVFDDEYIPFPER